MPIVLHSMYFNFGLPVINDYSVHPQTFAKNSTKDNGTTLQDIADELINKPEEKVVDLITKTYTRLQQP